MKNIAGWILCLTCLFSLSVAAEDARDPDATTGAAAAPAASPATAAAEPALTGPALELKKKLEVLFEHSKHVNSADAAKKSAARAAIDTALDWERVAEDAMGSGTWKKQSAKNRGDFKNLLKDVIVRTAYTRLDKFWDGATTYSFGKIDVKGGKADVPAKFMVKGDEFTLNYYLHNKSGKWIVYDIAFEGERYSVNINEQIAAYLNEKSFSSLMDKLRKRRDDLASDPSGAKKG